MSAGAARADEASALAKAEAAVAAERVRSTQESLLEAQKLVAEKAKAVQDAKDFQERKKRENAEADGALSPCACRGACRGACARAWHCKASQGPLIQNRDAATDATRPTVFLRNAAAAFAAALAKGKK